MMMMKEIMIDNANEDNGHLHRTGNHQGGSKSGADNLPINNHCWRIWNIVDYLVKEFKRVLNILCNIISRSKMTVRESACRICLKNMLFAMIGCCKFCTNWNAARSTKTVVGYILCQQEYFLWTWDDGWVENEDLQMTSRVILRLTVGGTPFWKKSHGKKNSTRELHEGANLRLAEIQKYLKYCFL